MAYAVIRIHQKQYQLSPGDEVVVIGTIGQVGETVEVGEILLLKDKTVEIGTPTLNGEVKFRVKDHQKSPKITVKTFKAKSRYRRTKGHRQPQTVLELIQAGSLKTGQKHPQKAAPAQKTPGKSAPVQKLPKSTARTTKSSSK